MENEKKEKLSRFLISRTEKDVLSRGRSIYSSGGFLVTRLDYNGSGNGDFKVKSDYSINPFLIKIKDFLTPQLSTSCTCSYSQSGLCKHRVAAILYILDKMPNVNPVAYQMEKTVVELPELTDGHMKRFVSEDTWRGRDSRKEVIIVSAKDGDSECEVRDEKEQVYTVHLNRVQGTRQVQTSCSCNQRLWVPLCEHKLAALLELREKLGERAFEMMRDRTDEKNALLAEYGYSLADDIKDKFDFKLNSAGVLILEKWDQSIQKVGNHQNWSGLRKKILPPREVVFQVTAGEINKEEEERISLFVFWPKSATDIPDVGFGVFTAKFSGKSAKLTQIRNIAGGSSHYYSPDEIPVLTESDARLVRIARHFEEGTHKFIKKQGWASNAFTTRDDLNEEQLREVRNLTGKQLLQIFNDLDSERTYISENEYVGGSNDLLKVGPNRNPVKLFFTLTEDREFVTLNPYVELVQGSPVELQQITPFGGFWMGIYNEQVLFRWSGRVDAEMAEYLRQNGNKIKIRKEYANSFLTEWVMPVTEQFDVLFQTRHAIDTISLQLKTLRVYLKEDDENLMLVPAFVYEGDSPEEELEFMHDQRKTKASFEEGRIVIQERDTKQERLLWDWVESLHDDFERQSDQPFFHIPFEEVMKGAWLFQFVEAMQEKGYELLGFKDLKKMRFNPNRGKFQVKASSGIDWFDMQVDISFGDQYISLTEVRKALLKKQNYVQLKDGSLGILPEEWIKKLEPMLKLGRMNGDKIHLSKVHFSLMDGLISKLEDEELWQELWEKKQKLLHFKEMASVPIPDNTKATLRHYQEEGFKWLNFLDEFGWGGCLADDMGLGKTVQMLVFLQHQKNKNPGTTNLVLVPTTLIFNWQAEAQKFTPELNLYVHRGMGRRKDIDFFSEYDIILTTYGTMRSDVDLLKGFNFHYIILDEAQAIKNPDSLTSRASRQLKAKNRLTMTGTPVENNTFDLYSQFEFLNPGMLGNAEFFRSEYATPIDKNQDKDKAEELRRLVYPFMLKRTKEEVATDLPDKTETVLFCEMGKKQRKVYDTFREKYRDQIAEKLATEGLNKSSFLILEALLKLRQICDSPFLLSDDKDFGTDSAKLDEIIREIEENASNHKILIFSQFLGMLDLIRQHLEKVSIPYEYLDGQTTDRENRVNRFQNDQSCRVFLMSLKAGGVGLNLTEADYVYLVDPWWNPAVERQAIDRTHRIGQTRKVFAYKMICKDTIEEKILLLQQRKQTLAEDLVGGESGFIKKLSQEDIMGLFN
jgi:SNF2 family DNA or RNA helicase